MASAPAPERRQDERIDSGVLIAAHLGHRGTSLVHIADCSDLVIVPTSALIGLARKGIRGEKLGTITSCRRERLLAQQENDDVTGVGRWMVVRTVGGQGPDLKGSTDSTQPCSSWTS